jgi:hypothetical protein
LTAFAVRAPQLNQPKNVTVSVALTGRRNGLFDRNWVGRRKGILEGVVERLL